MNRIDDPYPPIADWILDAYTVLSASLSEATTDESHGQVPAISRDQAVDVLLTADELALEPDDADHALTRLLDRGYLYAVDDELRVTTPPE